MKKFLAFVMAASMALSLAACGGSSASTATSTTTEATSEAAASTSGSKTDVAFVTDVGNIDDQSFNQYTWQGVQDFCSANSLNANYYRPTEDSDAARLEQMDNAVNDGAKSIVVAGYLFGSAIAEAQEKYPDVQFLALDVSTSDLGDKAPTANTALITYKEEQAGYLAGYAAVYDGYKELGFLGGMAVPAVIRYGSGFIQGADAAAAEKSQDAPAEAAPAQEQPQAQAAKPAAKTQSSGNKKQTVAKPVTNRTVRVDIEKLDALMNQVSAPCKLPEACLKRWQMPRVLTWKVAPRLLISIWVARPRK